MVLSSVSVKHAEAARQPRLGARCSRMCRSQRPFELKDLRRHDHEDDHDGEELRDAEAGETPAHQLDLTDEARGDVGRPRVGLQFPLECLASAGT